MRFRVGALLSIQMWTAIIGVGFGLLSYGFSEAHVHLFDWWCTRQAARNSGLDYGRYLNTLPRAPVVYRVRAFVKFATLRYLVIALSVGVSIGYKFGILQVLVDTYENLDAKDFTEVSAGVYISDGVTDINADWLIDKPAYENNKQFVHQLIYTHSNQPPKSVVLTRPLLCTNDQGYFGSTGQGNMTFREIVLVSELMKEQKDFYMTESLTNWYRVESQSQHWLSSEMEEAAVVEYRVPEPGKMQIQWARTGNWIKNSDGGSQRVHRRLNYTMQYAVAEVRRGRNANGCGYLNGTLPLDENVRFLSHGSSTKFTRLDNTETQFWTFSDSRTLIEALVMNGGSSVESGASSLVRGIMTIQDRYNEALSKKYNTPSVNFEPTDSTIKHLDPALGPDDEALGRRAKEVPYLSYPYYQGTRSIGAIGLHIGAAIIFCLVGIIALVTLGVRIWIGPPSLTSWIAQHIHLSQMGVLSLEDDQKTLENPYLAAPHDLWRLHTKGYGEVEDSETSDTELDEFHMSPQRPQSFNRTWIS
ncbi:unnamed protein product [Clonostachys rosea f. rosea IK726]|uniref:Uncharacterized protein n=1 Tax=Clonostachys rosea f. rosea IK726 TaxID=1349383 RepID=A0ACA9U1Z5_BIOOC|nr:unnamed protein product [Clonostachys rosea f. rosea IK726]